MSTTIDDITISLQNNQIKECLALTTNMIHFMQRNEISFCRPKKSVKDEPKAWWKYDNNI
jgi:hypothetical protein